MVVREQREEMTASFPKNVSTVSVFTCLLSIKQVGKIILSLKSCSDDKLEIQLCANI